MNILILQPRMDVAFKEGIVPDARGPIPPIRQHWLKFVELCATEHRRRKDNVTILELPLWQFTPEMVVKLNPDVVYVPHREKHSFTVPSKKIRVLYYMQSIFPWIFYVDPLGFAGGASIYPMDIKSGNSRSSRFDVLQKYVHTGASKFEQPPTRGFDETDYVLFLCQLPHDQTILYHSDVTVEQALQETCEVTKKLNVRLIVKGHPVNPSSMMGLKSLCAKYTHSEWYDNISIHDLIPNARVVVVVNSGTGMESLLRLRPVVTYGRCEYDAVTMKVKLNDNLEQCITNPTINEKNVRKFFDRWSSLTYDTTNPITFKQLGVQ